MTTEHAMYADKRDSYFDNPRTEIEPLLPDRADRVLEIGCGAGATMRWLRDRRHVTRAVGVELMPEAAARAAAVFDEVITGNVESMDLPPGRFDFIVALDVLEHLADPWSAVRRLHAILAPGGCILVSLPNIGHYSVALPLLTRGRWEYAEDGLLDRTHLQFFSRRTAIELMTCSGLVADKIGRVRPPPQWMWRLSSDARWYGMRALGAVLPGHLLDFQLLIRARATDPTAD